MKFVAARRSDGGTYVRGVRVHKIEMSVSPKEANQKRAGGGKESCWNLAWIGRERREKNDISPSVGTTNCCLAFLEKWTFSASFDNDTADWLSGHCSTNQGLAYPCCAKEYTLS